MNTALRMPASRTRDWHNYDYMDRETWLAWPWPEPAPEPVRARMTRLLARLAGLVASLPPDRQQNRAESRP